ncbi:hypothetical protein O4H66_04545 [Comamonadaceae bacterium G21597-S1]|nr:hypothetical protein [Comamonadaceae bacterium G21597-S1]
MKRIVLHVDRLVLNGIDRTDAQALSAALQAELQRLLSVPGATTTMIAAGNQLRVRSAPVTLAPGGGMQAGQAVAGSIVKGVAR